MRLRLMTILLLLIAPLVVWFALSKGLSWQQAATFVLLLVPTLWTLLTLFVFAISDGDLIITGKSAPPSGAFKDKVVWITGASKGFGEQLAKNFDSLGAKLILSSRQSSELERVKDGLSGKDIVVLPLDLSAGEAVITEAVEKAESSFNGNGVDIMVHNAAHPRSKLGVLDISEKHTQAAFEVNVMGTMTLTRLLAPRMVSRSRGHFVVLSSLGGKIPSPGQAIYSATKFALQGYFGAVRNEIGYTGIKVTLVCPGPVADTHCEHAAKERQPLERVVDLTMKAVYHEVEEVWIALHPLLSLVYVQQFFPSVASYILQKLGPKRVKQGNTYSLTKMLRKGKAE